MWIYYYCMYGPGHQSRDDGFEYFHDSYDMETIKEIIGKRYDYAHQYSLTIYPVDKPSSTHLKEEIKSIKNKRKGLLKRLKMLEIKLLKRI